MKRDRFFVFNVIRNKYTKNEYALRVGRVGVTVMNGNTRIIIIDFFSFRDIIIKL